jgi:hypothetical protein
MQDIILLACVACNLVGNLQLLKDMAHDALSIMLILGAPLACWRLLKEGLGFRPVKKLAALIAGHCGSVELCLLRAGVSCLRKPVLQSAHHSLSCLSSLQTLSLER